MNKEYEQFSLEFTTKAQKLFIFTFEQFRDSTKKLNRQKDENVFQLQVGKFVATLKQQLENIAIEIMKKNSSLKNSSLCNKILTDHIKNYLNEFRRKSRAL